MTLEAPPDLYFRLRENGATVFRIGGQNRMRRLEMTQIASVNIRTGAIKPHGKEQPDEAESTKIAAWVAERRLILRRREDDEIAQLIERINLAAHWAQSRATDEQIAEAAPSLLLAMHDLRGVLVRKHADKLKRGADAGGDAP